MPDSVDTIQALEAIKRWRESCVFYFKFDLALIAAIAAAVSFFNIHGSVLIATASQYKVALIYVICLLVYALIYEWLITGIGNRVDLSNILLNQKSKVVMYRVLSWGYDIQVLLHLVLLAGALAFATGYVDGFMSACNSVAGRCAGT